MSMHNRSIGTPLENLLPRLDKARKTGPDRWLARCPGPAHHRGDKHPSLAITEKPGGHVLMFCPVCQDTAAILDAVGLTFSDLYPPKTDEPMIKGERRPFAAIDLFRAVAFETTVVLLAARDMLEAGDLVLGDEGFTRLEQAHDRIQSALSLAMGGTRHG